MAAVGALLALGIPLWLVGAAKPSTEPPERAAGLPTVLVGQRTATARWSF